MRCPRKRFSSGEDAWELKNRWEYRSRKKVISNWTRNCLQAKITSLVRDKCSLSWNNCKGSNTEVLKRIWTQITSRGGGGSISTAIILGAWGRKANSTSRLWQPSVEPGTHCCLHTALPTVQAGVAHRCQSAGAKKAIAPTQPHPWDGIHTPH